MRAIRRLIPPRVMLSVPLGDERVIVARSVRDGLEKGATKEKDLFSGVK